MARDFRVLVLVAAVATAALGGCSRAPEGPAAGRPGAALAIGLWLAAIAPQWIMLLWGVKHLGAIQEAVGRHIGWRLLAAGCWTSVILLAFAGTVLVCRDVLGSERLSMQRILSTGTLVQEGLLIGVGLLIVSKRRRNRTVANDGKEPEGRR